MKRRDLQKIADTRLADTRLKERCLELFPAQNFERTFTGRKNFKISK